jgi:autotransporter-associated beta strand protein
VYSNLTVGNVTAGALTVSGGILTGTTLIVGSLGTGTVTVSGGTYSTTTVTINSTVVFTGGVGLNGGVLSTTSVTAAPLVGATTLTFNGGTLQASANNATFTSGFPTGSLTLGALGGTIDTNGFSIATADQISGSGLLTTTGTGILTLTANNTYTGGTTINSGTLQLGNGGTTGSIVNNVINDGALVFNRSDAVTFAGTVSGLGSLVQTGTGATTLTGDSTYTGGTIIMSSCTLQLGSGGTTGFIMGDVIDDGVLVFNRADTVTFSGAISGTGALAHAGTGATTLIGDNTYTGTTTISSGTLRLGEGGITGSLAGDVMNNGVLVFHRTDDVTFAGSVSGTGSLIHAGSGALILAADNTYTGVTTINLGTLQLGSYPFREACNYPQKEAGSVQVEN